MRIFRPAHDAQKLQNWCFPVNVLPRLLISLYLLTIGYKQVVCTKLKSAPAQLPTFRNTSPEYTFTEGGTALLYCSIQNLGARTVVWRKATNSNPLTVGPMTYVDDSRFQIGHVPEKGEWNLMIKNVQLHDAGMYECQVSTKEKYIRKLIRVTIKERPYADRAIVIKGPETVKKGESLMLSCDATGGKSAPQDLNWERASEILTADRQGRINITKHISYVTNTITSNLTIKNVKEDDAGTYLCKTSDEMVKNVTVEVTGEGSENVKRTITQHAPATSCATSSTVVLYVFVFLVHCSLQYGQFMERLASIFIVCRQNRTLK